METKHANGSNEMTTATERMVSQIESIFGKVERISADHADRLLTLLDKAPDEALQIIVDRKIKFCWMPAQRRLNDRKAK